MSLAIELFTNLFQSVMYIGFLYFYFDKPEGKLKRLFPFLGGVFTFFCVSSFLTLTGMHISASTYYLDSLAYILILEIYALCFLKGKLYLRIIMPIIDFGVNTLVSYSFSYVASFISGIPLEVALTESTNFRYFCIVVVNLTTAALLWLVLRTSSKRIRLSGALESTAFTVIPILCMVIIYCGFSIYQKSGFDSTILLFIFISCFVMVIIAALIYIMLIRISKANKLKTEYLLAKQHEKLYEESTLSTNMQIEKISAIKHDMKNKLMSLKNLINQGASNEAVKLCEDTSKKLEATYTPISSTNPILNAIVNVELEKAFSADINIAVDISNSLSNVSSADTVSLIGNLCDNAIEYLSKEPKENRKMILQVHSQINCHIITCKNKISGSILQDNPNLTTTKSDSDNHGLGLNAVKRIANEYDGEVMFSEENDWFIASIMLCSR